MNKLKYCLLALSVFFSQLALAQSAKPTVIPFTLTEYNNLSVKAVINKKDTVNLMFHTAADALMLTEAAVKRITSIDFNRTDTVSSWGGQNSSRFSKSNTLQIAGLTWEDLPIWEDQNSGQHTDGKFGPNLFDKKVVEIDFDKKVIIVSNSLPNKAKNYEQLKLTYSNGNMFIEGSCQVGENAYKNRFLVHSGYSGGILLDDKFVSENKLGEHLKITGEKSLKDSYGNIIKTKKAVLPAFALGKSKLNDVPVGFFEGSIGRQKMSIIGGDVLKRFNIIIDAERNYVYLKPNSLKKTAYSNLG